MSLRIQFNYRVEEAANQMNMWLKPAGETAGRLADDFAISVGYSKDYSEEKILSTIVPHILKNTADEISDHDGVLEFIRSDGHVVTIKYEPGQ